METQMLEPFKLAYVRLVGPYGQGIPEAIDKIHKWSATKGLADIKRVHIFHDDPDVTPAEDCRADIGVMVPCNVKASEGIQLQQLPGGKYITARKHTSSVPQIIEIWDNLIEQMITSGDEMDDRPCFELYHSHHDGTVDVGVFISVK